MITKGKLKVPISAGAGQFQPKPSVLTNQATTSAGAQRIVRQPPQDQGNPHGILRVPAGVNQNFAKDQRPYGSAGGVTPRPSSASQPLKNFSVHKGTSHSAAEMAAVGYSVNATRGTNSIHNGFPTRNPQRVIGGGNFPANRGRRS
jgi:hypothetical protein